MKLSFLLILSFLLFQFSCKNNSETPVVKPQKFDHKKYAESIKSAENQNEKKESIAFENSDSLTLQPDNSSFRTDTIYLKIHNGKIQIDTVKLPRQKIVFQFNSDTANGFKAKISTQDSVANLRISQIIDAKGNSDGPFGREINYKIQEKGIQNVVVSESQMAGEPWGGKFTFELSLSW